jgi:hypothetical protein
VNEILEFPFPSLKELTLPVSGQDLLMSISSVQIQPKKKSENTSYQRSCLWLVEAAVLEVEKQAIVNVCYRCLPSLWYNSLWKYVFPREIYSTDGIVGNSSLINCTHISCRGSFNRFSDQTILDILSYCTGIDLAKLSQTSLTVQRPIIFSVPSHPHADVCLLSSC